MNELQNCSFSRSSPESSPWVHVPFTAFKIFKLLAKGRPLNSSSLSTRPKLPSDSIPPMGPLEEGIPPVSVFHISTLWTVCSLYSNWLGELYAVDHFEPSISGRIQDHCSFRNHKLDILLRTERFSPWKIYLRSKFSRFVFLLRS